MKWKLLWLVLALAALPACGILDDWSEVLRADPGSTPTTQTTYPDEADPTPASDPPGDTGDTAGDDPAGETGPAPETGGPGEDDPVGDSTPPEYTASPPPEEPDPLPIEVGGLMPEGAPVEEEWFADAVFIGDSRTDGLSLYSGIRGAAFYSYKGLSVFTVDDKACINLDGEVVTVPEALSRKQFAKVYILLGINELGYVKADSFKEAYTALVDIVQELQPEADIYLQLQPPLNEAMAANSGLSDGLTNARILMLNEVIAQVAEEQGTALVNVWESLADENGALPADLTSDGVHMKRAGYEIWYDYLRRHTGTTWPAEEDAGGADVLYTQDPGDQ